MMFSICSNCASGTLYFLVFGGQFFSFGATAMYNTNWNATFLKWKAGKLPKNDHKENEAFGFLICIVGLILTLLKTFLRMYLVGRIHKIQQQYQSGFYPAMSAWYQSLVFQVSYEQGVNMFQGLFGYGDNPKNKKANPWSKKAPEEMWKIAETNPEMAAILKVIGPYYHPCSDFVECADDMMAEEEHAEGDHHHAANSPSSSTSVILAICDKEEKEEQIPLIQELDYSTTSNRHFFISSPNNENNNNNNDNIDLEIGRGEVYRL